MKKLKCYFAFSNDIDQNSTYIDMLEVCLKSARLNTKLELCCLYDGELEDRLYNILLKYEVNVTIAKIEFEAAIKKIYTDEYMNKVFGHIITSKSLRSRFLRMMIPLIENESDYILYCDTDVFFLQDITLQDFGSLPKYISVGPEFERGYEFSYFNAGVMLINMASARERYHVFTEMIERGEKAKVECCDQGYLNDIYAAKFNKFPLTLNWKPYWGINNEAKIIHLHGLKPSLSYEAPSKLSWLTYCLDAYGEDVSLGLFYYFSMYSDFLEKGSKNIFTNTINQLLVNKSQSSCKYKKIYIFQRLSFNLLALKLKIFRLRIEISVGKVING